MVLLLRGQLASQCRRFLRQAGRGQIVLVGHRALCRIDQLVGLLVSRRGALGEFRSIDMRHLERGLIERTLRVGLGVVAVFECDHRRRRQLRRPIQARSRRFAYMDKP
jgi:hypothetical protein